MAPEMHLNIMLFIYLKKIKKTKSRPVFPEITLNWH